MIASIQQVENQLQHNTAAIVHRLDDLDSRFWRQNSQVLPLPSASVFWTEKLALITNQRKFSQLAEAAYRTKSIGAGWDGYDAPTPNATAIAASINVLSLLRDMKLTPYSVLASADGGVGISFRANDNRRAVLELLNDGTISYMLYGKGYPTESSEIDSTTELQKTLQRLMEYL